MRIGGSPLIGYSVRPRWKYATPAALALISPTRSIRAVLRQLGSWSRCGRSEISVIRPTMTVLPLTTPRNFPTVARDRLPGRVGVSPMVTCAPLTARTRPSVSRGARAGAAGEAAGGFTSVILAPSVAVEGCPPGGPLQGHYIRNDLGVSVKPELALELKPEINCGSCGTLKKPSTNHDPGARPDACNQPPQRAGLQRHASRGW